MPIDICWRCGKLRHQKGQPCKDVEAVCRNCGMKGHYEKVCMKKSTNLVGIPDISTNSDSDYFDEHGEPVYMQTHMVHTKEIHKKKHLIQFPIRVNTGANVNLLNLTTFDKIIGDKSILQPSTLKMEAYGNSTVALLKKFYAFLQLKGKIYRQLFFVTTANALPNLLSRDGCYMLGVLKLCYSVEISKSSSAQPTTDLEQCQMHGESFLHLSDEGTGGEKLSHSTQQSLCKDQL